VFIIIAIIISSFVAFIGLYVIFIVANSFVGEKSIVAMIHLSWNLARNVKIAERKLFEHIR